MRPLVAEKGELGEDHSECTSDQQLQPGVVEEDQPDHRTRNAVNTSEEQYDHRTRPCTAAAPDVLA